MSIEKRKLNVIPKPQPPSADSHAVRNRVTGITNSPPPPMPVKQEASSVGSVQTKSTSQFNNDGRYVLLSDLPTRYLFYDFKELWIRPFTPNEARLIHMARVSGNLTYLISAVSACINVPITKLILEDFDFCIYWLRINSYPKRPFNVTWTCLNSIETSDAGKKKSNSCKKENLSAVTKTNLNIINLEPGLQLSPLLAFPRMDIFEELWEIRTRLEAISENEDIDPEVKEEREELLGDVYLMTVAQWLREGDTLADKLEVLKNQPSMDFQIQVEDEINKLTEFGVSEEITLTCVSCGGTTRRRLSLDYLSFFP